MDSEEDSQFIKSLEQEYTCSITKLPMTDPVIAADGHTYERQAITEWFKDHTNSPNTLLELPNTEVVPNTVLKNVINRINTDIYGFFNKEKALKAFIQQLKEEIDYLKVELQHQKERNDEHIERQEREFRTRKIQKRRHGDVDAQLKVIRNQKNDYQKQLLALRVKDRQQNREILLLKEQLKSTKQKLTDMTRFRKLFETRLNNYNENRDECMFKVRNSFSSNLVFICHLLKSIDDVKNFVEPQLEQEEKRQKGTEESINVERVHDEERRNLRIQMRQEVIKEIQQGIEERICGLRREAEQENEDDEMEQQIHRLIIHRRIMQRRGEGHLPPLSGVTVNVPPRRPRRIAGRPDIEQFLRINRRPVANLPTVQQSSHEAESIPQSQPQLQSQLQTQSQSQTQPQSQPQPQFQSPQPQTDTQNQPQPQLLANSNDSQLELSVLAKRQGLVQQLQSIKWLMSKRNYRKFPEFYDYQFIRQHKNEDKDGPIYWFGVRIRVLESRIPFVDYLTHCWDHVRILDLSASNIDDSLWKKFIQSRQNFDSLAYICLRRNNITNVQKNEITDFVHLKNFIITHNRLSDDSRNVLRELTESRKDIKIEYDQLVDPANLGPDLDEMF